MVFKYPLFSIFQFFKDDLLNYTPSHFPKGFGMADKNTLNRLKETHEENQEKNCKLFHTHTHKNTHMKELCFRYSEPKEVSSFLRKGILQI